MVYCLCGRKGVAAGRACLAEDRLHYRQYLHALALCDGKKELLRGFATAPMGIFGDQIFSSLAASFQIASAVLFITFTASARLPDFSSLRAVSFA